MRLRVAALGNALACLNVHMLRLLMSRPEYARQYCSAALHRYDDLTGRGLPARNPLHFMYAEGWAPRQIDERIELPIDVHAAGGTRPEELVILAMVTRATIRELLNETERPVEPRRRKPYH